MCTLNLNYIPDRPETCEKESPTSSSLPQVTPITAFVIHRSYKTGRCNERLRSCPMRSGTAKSGKAQLRVSEQRKAPGL